MKICSSHLKKNIVKKYIGSLGALTMKLHAIIFFKLNLIFTTTGSSGAQMGEVQARQTRQFTSNKLEFLF
jgi:hypothetical protein